MSERDLLETQKKRIREKKCLDCLWKAQGIEFGCKLVAQEQNLACKLMARGKKSLPSQYGRSGFKNTIELVAGCQW